MTSNATKILAYLREQPNPVTRTDIEKATGISVNNMARPIAELLESGHVREVPRDPPTRNYAPLLEAVRVSHVTLSEPAQKVVRYLRTCEERPSYRSIQAATGANSSVIATLRHRKIVHPARLELTQYGKQVADGEVAIETQTHGPKLPERKPVAEDKPAPVVTVPAALVGYRGIKHPPIPGPAERPQGVTARAWEVRTTPEHSPLHNACARGLW